MTTCIVEMSREKRLALRVGDIVPSIPIVEDVYRIDTAAAHRWFAIQTNPKCEARASDRIERAGFEPYAPKARAWGKRNPRTNKMPRLIRNLFPGYLFARLPAEGVFDLVRRCDGVNSIIANYGAPEPIPDRWIDGFRDREAAGEFDYTKRRPGVRADGPFPEWIFEGAIVRVVAGPFLQFLALVVEAVQAGRVKAEVSIFGRTTVVDFDLAQLGPMA